MFAIMKLIKNKHLYTSAVFILNLKKLSGSGQAVFQMFRKRKTGNHRYASRLLIEAGWTNYIVLQPITHTLALMDQVLH